MGEPDLSLDALLDRYRVLTSECLEACTDLARRAVADQTGDSSILRDAWMTWAGLAGKAVEASYITAALADSMLRSPRDRA